MLIAEDPGSKIQFDSSNSAGLFICCCFAPLEALNEKRGKGSCSVFISFGKEHFYSSLKNEIYSRQR